jgi:subtilisin family serine protease
MRQQPWVPIGQPAAWEPASRLETRRLLPPAGTIAGERNNGKGVAGVAPHAKVVSAKFLGKAGGSTANAIKAFDYLTGLKTKGINLRVINNSCELHMPAA